MWLDYVKQALFHNERVSILSILIFSTALVRIVLVLLVLQVCYLLHYNMV